MTAANLQAKGDSSTIIAVNPAGMSLGSSGAGATWDFSTQTNTGTLTRTSVAVGATPYAGLYPDATIAEHTLSGSSDNYQFYRVSGDSVFVVGISGNVIDSTRYLDEDEVMILPFQLNDSLSDSSICTEYLHGSSKLVVHAKRTTIADASGTLKLPNGIYDNVLRYKVVSDQDISVLSGATVVSSFNYHIEEYIWAGAGYRSYLCYYNPVKLKGGVQQSQAAHYWSDPKAVSTTSLQLPRSHGNLLRRPILYANGAYGIEWTAPGAKPVISGADGRLHPQLIQPR